MASSSLCKARGIKRSFIACVVLDCSVVVVTKTMEPFDLFTNRNTNEQHWAQLFTCFACLCLCRHTPTETLGRMALFIRSAVTIHVYSSRLEKSSSWWTSVRNSPSTRCSEGPWGCESDYGMRKSVGSLPRRAHKVEEWFLHCRQSKIRCLQAQRDACGVTRCLRAKVAVSARICFHSVSRYSCFPAHLALSHQSTASVGS